MKKSSKLVIILFVISTISLTSGLSSCIPDIPTPIPIPQGEPTHAVGTIDDLGCFPAGCDLPAGMKELCEAYQTGTISWPGNCSDMPGQACQALCEREKASMGIDLPTTVIDAYQVGWTQPIQIDDNIDDAWRIKHSWVLPAMDIDNQGLVHFWYNYSLGGGQFIPFYTRTWDGSQLSEAEEWPLYLANTVFDSQGNLHGVEPTNKGDADQSMTHVIRNGEQTTRQPLYPGQFVKPEVWKLVIDEQDNLHMVFVELSSGLREVWYARYEDGVWLQAEKLSHSVNDSWWPTITVGQNGKIYASWHERSPEFVGGSGLNIMTVFDGQSWSKPEFIPLRSQGCDITADTLGNVHVMTEGYYTFWDGEKWSEIVTIDYPGNPTAFYHWTLDRDNNLHFVWNRLITQDNVSDEEERVQREFFYRIRHADGSWSPVMTFGLWGTSPSFEEVHSTIRADQNGVIHIAMAGNTDGLTKQYYLNSGGVVQDASLLALESMPPQPRQTVRAFPEPEMMSLAGNTGWGTPEKIDFIPPTGDQIEFDTDSDPNGNIHLLWRFWVGDDTEIFHSQTDGISWSDAVNISNADMVDFQPSIAAVEDGRLHAAWVRGTPGTPVMAYSARDGDTWLEPERISRPISWVFPLLMTGNIESPVEDIEEVTTPVIAADQSVQVAAICAHRSIGYSDAVAFTLKTDSGWSKEEILAKEHDPDPWPYSASTLNLDYSPDGLLHALFNYSGYINPTVWLYLQPVYTFFDGASWAEPQLLLPLPAPEDNVPGAQEVADLKMAVIDKDDIYAALSYPFAVDEWAHYQSDLENNYASLMHWDGSSWGERIRLDSSTCFGPTRLDIDVDKRGMAHIVWSKYDSYSQTLSIYYTTYDGNSTGEVVRLWQFDYSMETSPFTVKPHIVVDSNDNISVFFNVRENDDWRLAWIKKSAE